MYILQRRMENLDGTWTTWETLGQGNNRANAETQMWSEARDYLESYRATVPDTFKLKLLYMGDKSINFSRIRINERFGESKVWRVYDDNFGPPS